MSEASAESVSVHGTVECNYCQEMCSSVTNGTDQAKSVMLRLRLRDCTNDDQPRTRQVECLGQWAEALSFLQAGDKVNISGAVISNTEAAIIGANASKVTITRPEPGRNRSLCAQVLNGPDLKADRLPAWARPPSQRKRSRRSGDNSSSAGEYEYFPALTTLQLKSTCNVWGVVWENLKPGANIYKDDASMNVAILDPSVACCAGESTPCSLWNADRSCVPSFSLQVTVPAAAFVGTGVKALPFLCIGDVVRCHRMWVASKIDRGPKYINLHHSFNSSIVTWEGGLQGSPDMRLVNTAQQATAPSQSDKARLQKLREWAHGRLSKETFSNYLVSLSDLNSGSGSVDLVVRVEGVDVDNSKLVVTDGSTMAEPLGVQGHQETINWLFTHVQRGMWLRLRHVGAAAGQGHSWSVDAANVTRMPDWCFDVQQRIKRLPTAPPGVVQAPPPPPPPPPSASLQAPRDAGNSDAVVHEGTSVASSSITDAHALNTTGDSDRTAAGLAKNKDGELAVTCLFSEHAKEIAPISLQEAGQKASFLMHEGKQLAESFTVSNFVVSKVLAWPKGTSLRASDNVLFFKCRECHLEFAAPSLMEQESFSFVTMRLPCGHCFKDPVVRLSLELKDSHETQQTPEEEAVMNQVCQEFDVQVIDKDGSFCGVSPLNLLKADNKGQARADIQQLMDGLLRECRSNVHTATLLWQGKVDGPMHKLTCPSSSKHGFPQLRGYFVLADTQVVPQA